MSDLNQCQFIGRLGADPEVRSAGSNKVSNLRLAVGEQWKNKDGERQEKTEWVSVTVWGDGLIGVIEKYVKKGSKIYISGKMQTRKWQDKDGADRYSTEIVLQGPGAQMIMLDGKSDSSGGSRDSGGGRSERKPERSSQQRSSGFSDDLDADIPF